MPASFAWVAVTPFDCLYSGLPNARVQRRAKPGRCNLC